MTGRVGLRPAGAADRDFLLEVYAGTRADEMALVDWPEEQKRAFMRMQFEAQDRHYSEQFPQASFDIVEAEGVPVGRLCVDRTAAEIRIVDIALLPAHRGAGTGTELLERILAEAAGAGRTVSIHVEQFNPALRLYQRLGFAQVSEHGIHLLMRWAPPAQRAQVNTAS